MVSFVFHKKQVNGFRLYYILYYLFVWIWIWIFKRKWIKWFKLCAVNWIGLDWWEEVAIAYKYKHLTRVTEISQFELGILNLFNYFYFFMFVNTVRTRKNVKCMSLECYWTKHLCAVLILVHTLHWYNNAQPQHWITWKQCLVHIFHSIIFRERKRGILTLCVYYYFVPI